MLVEIAACVTRRESFSFETTLSGRSYLRHINQWQQQGYHVKLFFLTLPSAEMAVARVAERVRHGGHNIPEAVIRRRFEAGLSNFEDLYRNAVDAWAIYDNSGPEPAVGRFVTNAGTISGLRRVCSPSPAKSGEGVGG